MASSASVLEQVVHGPRNEAATDSPSGMSDEEQTASLVRELFIRSREARRELLQQWKRNYANLNNRSYRPGNQPWDEEPAVSSIWPVTASAAAWLTDQRPVVEVTPTAEPFSEYWDYYNERAQDMNTILSATYSNYALDAEVNKAWWDVYTYGIAYFKTQWDPTLADGLGDVCFRRVDPWTIYPDPHAKSPHEMTYIIEAKAMTVADADRAWPGAATKLRAAGVVEDTDEQPHKLDAKVNPYEPRANIGPLAPSTSMQSHVRAQGVPKITDRPVVTVLECYVRGYKTEDGEGEGVTKVIDDWRCIVCSGNVILMDEKCSDINAFGTHPYDRLVLFDTGEWYGPCVVEFLIPIQRMINWILGAINRNLYLMGNPVIVEEGRNPSRNAKWTNRPGQRVNANPKSVQWLEPPQPHPQMSVQLVQYYESKIETISGLSAMIRGFAPTGRNAQGVLDSVQDAAFVRVRASLRELRRSLNGVGAKMAANVAEFYTEPRLMSIIGPDGQRTRLSLQARHFYVLDADDRGKQIPLRFSLMADTGSEMPTSKQARAAEAKHLYELQAIDEYELLKAMDWPNYALVAQRMKEQKAMLAMAAGGNK